ncbi:hypothetical protein [[Limnothrix rosea] IAM M-220]|uniref:hypothetical protein n=1 Tax=[Limnothrix rosea] IAM M-220 TaxID=454133 RepID=UPI000962625C|nr:hypothetical protein [[Limnothrix rosea] IAM M-220]OKH18099.1 hypothetical protein NIES208_07080 [[Limnothrix rosea] IAM M-220]
MNWQQGLSQRFVERLQQPLNRQNMGQVLINRTDRFLTRFSLVEQQFQRWGKFQAVHGHTVPIVLVQQRRDLSDKTESSAAVQAQQVVNRGHGEQPNDLSVPVVNQSGRSPVSSGNTVGDLVIQRRIDPSGSSASIESSVKSVGDRPLSEHYAALPQELSPFQEEMSAPVVTSETRSPQALTPSELPLPTVSLKDPSEVAEKTQTEQLVQVENVTPDMRRSPSVTNDSVPQTAIVTNQVDVSPPNATTPDLTLIQNTIPEVQGRSPDSSNSVAVSLHEINETADESQSITVFHQPSTSRDQNITQALTLSQNTDSSEQRRSPHSDAVKNANETKIVLESPEINQTENLAAPNQPTELPLVMAQPVTPPANTDTPQAKTEPLPIVKTRLEQLLQRRQQQSDLPTVQVRSPHHNRQTIPLVQPLVPSPPLPDIPVKTSTPVQPLSLTQQSNSDQSALPLNHAVTGNPAQSIQQSSIPKPPQAPTAQPNIQAIATPIVESFHAPPLPSTQQPNPPIDIQAIANQVERKLRRKMVIERERRGQGRWR